MDGFTLIVVVAIGAVILFVVTRRAPEEPIERRGKEDSNQAGAAPAPSKSERLARIDEFHANELNAVTICLADCNLPPGDYYEAGSAVAQRTGRGQFNIRTGNRGADIGMALGNRINAAMQSKLTANQYSRVMLRRTLREIDEGQRALLRLAEILSVLGLFSKVEVQRVGLAVVWGGGKCLVEYDRDHSGRNRSAMDMGLQALMRTHGNPMVAHEMVQGALRDALAPSSRLAEEDRRILEQYLFAGSRWLAPGEIKPSSSPAALKLGTFEGTSVDFDYDRRESLITIAPPGAGKSQAHVLRNLLNLRTPAVVLDIKGEAFRTTARWRKEHVGPVFAFAPTMPNTSMHYNPLDGIGTGFDAWDEARKLSDLLFVPSNSDPYFENRARDLMTIALLDVALNEPAGQRHMGSVIDRLYLNDEEFLNWLEYLGETDVPALRRQANAWRSMPHKQREAVFDSARNHMESWQSPALASIIERSEWRPEDLRARNATLYLCVNMEDIKKYASVLRVIIGQTIMALCKGEPESNAPLVTFFLDEMPRLGRMDVLEEGLDVARGHGVRFWLFCQNLGQLSAIYKNADGMLGNCAARCFMDPDDQTAEQLARFLGQRKGLIDGKQKPLAEASELKGPDFADKVIVFSRGRPPAKLVRRMAFAEPEAQARLAAE
jgi:hypothetical protein